MAPEPGFRDRHGGGSLGEMAWRGIGFGRVGFSIRSEETDEPAFWVGDGRRYAPRVHGRRACGVGGLCVGQ